MCLFRFKLRWMIPSFGDSGCEVPAETQMLLLETREKSTVQNGLSKPTTENSLYILLLPVLDGPFRASLQGNTIPAHVDWFGWSTWDAFYHKVDPEGIEKGLKSLSEGGFPPKFLIIDEGWQNKVMEVEADETDSPYHATSVDRLTSIEENDKFKGFRSGKSYANLREFVKFIEEEYGLKLVYACHALIGSWGGVLPTSEEMRKYDPWIKHIVQSPGNVSHVICTTLGPMEKYGIGMIAPSNIYRFYDDLHSYLASCNVDGVKVDVQNVLELLGSCYGGRVALMGRYQEALEESLKQGAATRVSEGFMQMEPTFQTLRVAAVAFNSLLMGEIAVPDWDMFFSDHYTAEFHAAARALGGCPVYVQLRRSH
ncbi:PREDICTED: probable galactinol--sucrose [Prunus dulcis]|uniref:galactinol--sucrose galactosyltransferase n=1 Tax=Prunus dulcis TaxID=3755 RepID=A0A5E4FEK7_PRUDU|nr:PREDICTED: probable galactinol--sucrose [Prunus dulcis]